MTEQSVSKPDAKGADPLPPQGARPGEIVAAALASFADRGYAATKLEDVAAAAGVSKGTIYLYFPTKEDLFRAVVRQAVLPNVEAAEAESPATPVPPPICCVCWRGDFCACSTAT